MLTVYSRWRGYTFLFLYSERISVNSLDSPPNPPAPAVTGPAGELPLRDLIKGGQEEATTGAKCRSGKKCTTIRS